MTGPTKLVREEPIRPNPRITALDERSQRLVLAEFSAGTMCRYTLLWDRGRVSFPSESLETLGALPGLLSKPSVLVAGWAHDVDGPMRIRHQHLRSHLVESGWRVHTENGLGIAVRDVGPSGLDEVVRSLAGRDVGWFFAFGEWARLGTLLQAPLRKTMDLFCRNHRIAPSLEFLEGVGKYDGAFAYCSVGDDREPAVHLITSRQVGSALSECFALEESRE